MLTRCFFLIFFSFFLSKEALGADQLESSPDRTWDLLQSFSEKAHCFFQNQIKNFNSKSLEDHKVAVLSLYGLWSFIWSAAGKTGPHHHIQSPWQRVSHLARTVTFNPATLVSESGQFRDWERAHIRALETIGILREQHPSVKGLAWDHLSYQAAELGFAQQ